MVLIKKKKVNEKIITYYYQPEGEGDCGVITYVIKTGDFLIDKMSDRESKEFNMYRSKAFWFLKKFAESGEYPETKTIVWG